MDLYTLIVEVLGVGLFVVFLIVPAREFREIFRRLGRGSGSGRDSGDGGGAA